MTGSPATQPQRRFRLPWVLVPLAVAVIGCLDRPEAAESPQESRAESPREQSRVDPKRAYGYLQQVCRIGPRISGTEGMAKQRKLITEHFERLGGKVGYQSFDVAHPVTGAPVRMHNTIVSWHPESKQRVLICCHYDTRPLPDRDPRNPNGIFIGANDGGSGVAVLMELGHHMKRIEPQFGVDFVFFDGEELVYDTRGKYFHGSEHFATQYRMEPPEHKYLAGVLIDMVGDRKLELYMEINSLRYAPEVTKSVWNAAKRAGVREFKPRERHEIQDDHLPLNQIAEIPTCDIIDFDYDYWHTTQDVPQRCSGASLGKVTRVLIEWLERPNGEE